MECCEWVVSATPTSIYDIFKAAGKTCKKLPGLVAVQLAADATEGISWGDDTAIPVNRGGSLAAGETKNFPAVNPNTVPTEAIFLVGTAGATNIVSITVF